MARNLRRIPAALAVIFSGAALFAPAQAADAERPNPAFAKIVDDPRLPRVLLIGDSISIGYTLPVRELLRGQANVHRIPTNGGPTLEGLKHLDEWMGNEKWDVIHFNWGLGDLKDMRTPAAIAAGEPGKRQVTPEQYRANLQELVRRLKKSGAKLIWASTVPVPPGTPGRVADEVRYNEIAAEIMTAEQVAIDDLHAIARPRSKELQVFDGHFTPEGSRVLAVEVADSIRKALGPQ
jgi:acyl-CoA thioesterase-1